MTEHADWCATVRNPRQADAPVLCDCGAVERRLADAESKVRLLTDELRFVHGPQVHPLDLCATCRVLREVRLHGD